MRVDHLQKIVELCQQQGKAHELYFIARFQNRRDLSVQINNGKTEEIHTGKLLGVGLQVFNQAGYMGFAASDQITPEIVVELFEKAAFLAAQSAQFQGEANLEFKKLIPLQAKKELSLRYPYGSLTLAEIETQLQEMNQVLRKLDSRLAVRTLFRMTEEEWRIIRSDGTDVSFNTPRAMVYHSLTAKEGMETATNYACLPGIDLSLLVEIELRQKIATRAVKAAHLTLDLLKAGKIPSGNYKLVIDYALAKGLAHEAFGHAAETDHLESSILGEQGRMKTGMMVANPKLSIIDGSIPGDYAYQPFSAVGAERQTVRIVTDGRLTAGLADIFSADRAGVPPTGAERVESIFHLPIARMSNIHIEMKDPLPLEIPFEETTPAALYQLLKQYSLIAPGEKVLYLTGFQGGQVNPAFGDFVFHCSGIYELSEEPKLYKPAIFSGKVLSVLNSVSQAIGAMQLDAMGTCGKMGQGVPSCGGSHYFLMIESNPEIIIGGE